ncbi:winged helix-turn-helix transcriptional regulator [Moraxella marmotae]|uniref:winged helix-turn-helix transcriptional regulator n=1 Tax=Moraxella marmotae TaxID=3344520 RepID=UPI0035D4A0C7
MIDEMTISPADDGRGQVLAKNCPSRQILQHLTSRWGTLVMIVLQQGTKRFSELRREIEGISERMLTQTLQQLEQDGMVHRKSYHTVPPHVEYSLSEHGTQAAVKLADLVEWLEMHLPEILANQTRQ